MRSSVRVEALAAQWLSRAGSGRSRDRDRAASFLNSERWAIALAVLSGLKVDRGSTSKQISRRSCLGPDGTVMRPRHVERACCLGLSACRLPLADLFLVQLSEPSAL